MKRISSPTLFLPKCGRTLRITFTRLYTRRSLIIFLEDRRSWNIILRAVRKISLLEQFHPNLRYVFIEFRYGRVPTRLKAAITLSATYTRDSGWLESNQFLGTCYVNFRAAASVYRIQRSAREFSARKSREVGNNSREGLCNDKVRYWYFRSFHMLIRDITTFAFIAATLLQCPLKNNVNRPSMWTTERRDERHRCFVEHLFLHRIFILLYMYFYR